MNLTLALTLACEKIFNGRAINGVIGNDEYVIEDTDA